MKNLTLKTEKLNNLDTVLIGNGGNSRLDIMLDLETGELWADEYYDHEENSWTRYEDKNIICVGTARNSKMEDENGEEIVGCEWNITIYAPNSYCSSVIELSGDYYNDYYDVDNVIDVISMLYMEE